MSDNQDNYENGTISTGVMGGTVNPFSGPSFESGTSVENPFVGTPYVESGREIHAFGGPSCEGGISIEPRDVTGPGSPDSLWPTVRDILEQQGISNGNSVPTSPVTLINPSPFTKAVCKTSIASSCGGSP